MDKMKKKILVRRAAKLWAKKKTWESKVNGFGNVYKPTADIIVKFSELGYYALKYRIEDIKYTIKALKMEYTEKLRAA